MNTLPENNFDPAPEDAPPASEGFFQSSPAQASGTEPAEPLIPNASLRPIQSDPPLFQSFSQPEFHPPTRIPHLGHLAILAIFAFTGLLCASLLIRSALHFHLYGVTTLQDAVTDIHYTLGSEVILYLVMLGASLLFFPLIWHKSLFAGMQWNGAVAFKLRRRLFYIAAICCAFALANGLLLPTPTDAPIDKLFRAPGAAWFLFAFGVTFAPFFEEMVFRGFLLPALCTACDWVKKN